MKSRNFVATSVLAGMLAAGLTACGGQPAQTAVQPRATAVRLPTPSPLPTSAPASATAPDLSLGVTGIGEVKAEQDAELVFAVTGTVAQVLVEEGQTITKDQVLAVLDTRTFDQQVQQAQAQLDNANALASALNEPPRSYDVAAARAQLNQAQAALAQVQAGTKEQDVRQAEASLTASQTQLQSTRDQLSLSKTNAEAQVQLAAESLVQAQAAYAQAKSSWDYVQETGQNPQQPETIGQNSEGMPESRPNKVTDAQRQQYYAAYVQAEASLRQAEQNVERAKVVAEQARQAEILGIRAAEQQVVQAQAQLEKLVAPPDQDRLAAAQAAVVSAQAARERLNPNPTDSQRAQAAANIAQAEAALELARINRERAELRAPFDGVVAAVTIDPGDPSATGQDPAITVVDISKLHIDVQISDVDIPKVVVGQAAKVYAEALEQVYDGEVSYIAPTATVVGNVRTFLVRVALDKQDGLRAGMSVRVELPTS